MQMNEQFNNSNLQHEPEFSAQITNQHILAFNRLSQAGVRLVSHQIPGSGIHYMCHVAEYPPHHILTLRLMMTLLGDTSIG